MGKEMDRIIVRSIAENSRTLVILDAGHGINTPGKRSPVWENGTQLFEWEYNRYLVEKISQYLTASLISNVKLVQSGADMPLKERASLANKLYAQYKDKYFVYLVSIHGNAFNNPKVNGIEVFSNLNTDVSDALADIHFNELKELGWAMRGNTIKKPGKDANFAIVRDIEFPGILTESGFYTNEEECKKMLDPYWRNRVALYHVKAMAKIEFNKELTYGYVPKY